MSEKRFDEATGQETTGHSYDGIEELNTPLPKWWLYSFYICIVWGIGYTIAYPAWPMINSATSGVLGWSTRADVAQEIQAHEAENAALVEQLVSADLTQLDPAGDLHRYGAARGAAVFRAQCSQCHGSGAAGAPGGYPNLLDNDWLWGGDLETITYTIRHGIRNETDENARYSEMSAYGQILTEAEISDVVDHVMSFRGGAANENGAAIFDLHCQSCHGASGTGDQAQGAPNLTDAIWLYGSTREDLIYQVTYARNGVMPAWGQRLSEADVRAAAIYVHALGGGE